MSIVPTSPGKSWNLKRVRESPGISFAVKQSRREIVSLSKHQHFSGFLCMSNVAVHWLTAVIFIWDILNAIMSIYDQYITGWRYSNLQLRAESLNCGIACLTVVQQCFVWFITLWDMLILMSVLYIFPKYCK